MAYISFQTDKADYVFHGSNHIYGRIRPSIFEGINALVVEGGHNPDRAIYDGTLEERFLSCSALGNKDLRIKLRKEGVPIYEVDVSAKKDTNIIVGMILLPFSILDLLVSIPYSVSNRRLPRIIHQYSALVERLEADSLTLGRSVVAAEKIDEFVTPMVSKLNRNRRPKIGIIYGTGHQMVVDFLRSQENRKRFLAKYQRSGFRGFDKDRLDLVLRFQYDKCIRGWVPEQYRAELLNK